MKKLILMMISIFLLLNLTGCTQPNDSPKIGVAFGVGPAARWPLEIGYMEIYAKQMGVELTTRLNTDEAAKPFEQDCFELIDSGIDVLIVKPRDTYGMETIVEYAKKKNVKIISYAGMIFNEKIDLFIGYDCNFIGRKLGQYLSETVPSGDYILLSGDPKDTNVSLLLYQGAMEYLNTIQDDIHIILDTSVPNWSADQAKELVRQAVTENGGKIDAILAPNDKIAGACADVLSEMGITRPVAITGMDAELEAAQRIIAGTQSCTVYMDLHELAKTAMEQAILMGKNQQPAINTELDNLSGTPVPSNLITGQLVVQENLDRVLIDSGIYKYDQVYSTTNK